MAVEPFAADARLQRELREPSWVTFVSSPEGVCGQGLAQHHVTADEATTSEADS